MAIGNNGYTPPRPLTTADVVDNLMSSASDLPLSARQGSVLDGKIGQLSIDSLLVNGNFKINQRGQTTYPPTTSKWQYTVDRWCHRYNSTITSLSGGGVHVSCTNPNDKQDTFSLWQKVENYADYAGKTVTLSCKIKNHSGNKITICMTDGIGKAYREISEDGIYYTTLKVSENPTFLQVYFGRNSGSAQEYDIEWVKLELGSIATPFVPPDPAMELLKCQRHYCGNYIDGTAFMGGCSVGSTQNANIVNVPVMFPAEMRATPTVTIKEVVDVVSSEHMEEKTTFTAGNVSKKGFSYINAADGVISTVLGTNYYISYTADAEIY